MFDNNDDDHHHHNTNNSINSNHHHHHLNHHHHHHHHHNNDNNNLAPPIPQVWRIVLEGEDRVGLGGADDGLVRDRNLFGRGTVRREDIEAVASLEQACR